MMAFALLATCLVRLYPLLMRYLSMCKLGATSVFCCGGPPKTRKRSFQGEHKTSAGRLDWVSPDRNPHVSESGHSKCARGRTDATGKQNVSNKKTYPRFEDSRPSLDPISSSRRFRSATDSSLYTDEPSKNPRFGFKDASHCLTLASSSVRV